MGFDIIAAYMSKEAESWYTLTPQAAAEGQQPALTDAIEAYNQLLESGGEIDFEAVGNLFGPMILERWINAIDQMQKDDPSGRKYFMWSLQFDNGRAKLTDSLDQLVSPLQTGTPLSDIPVRTNVFIMPSPTLDSTTGNILHLPTVQLAQVTGQNIEKYGCESHTSLTPLSSCWKIDFDLSSFGTDTDKQIQGLIDEYRKGTLRVIPVESLLSSDLLVSNGFNGTIVLPSLASTPSSV